MFSDLTAKAKFTFWVPVLVWVIYAVVLGLTTLNHEPWFDEAQSWLIARDATPFGLLTDVLRYEGHPPLWYLLLMPFAKLGAPIFAAQIITYIIALAGMAVFLGRKTLPLPIKILLPFGFFFIFQYAAIARSYSLYLLLFPLLGTIYNERRKYVGRFTFLLVLIGNVSIHGLFVASAVYALFLLESLFRFKEMKAEEVKKGLLWLAVFIANGLFLIAVLLPPDDLLYAHRVDFAFNPLKMGKLIMLVMFFKFTGPVLSPLLHMSMCFWAWQRRFLTLFLVANGGVWVANYIYFNTWHEGISIVVWGFLIIVGYSQTTQNKGLEVKILHYLVTSLICLTLCIHAYWGFNAVRYDLKNSYSGAQEVARYLKEHNLLDKRIFGFNFLGISVNGHFDRNIFSNYHNGGGFAYWDWSTRNEWFYRSSGKQKDAHMFRKVAEMLEKEPDVVIIGYKFNFDRRVMNMIKTSGHYELVHSTEGNIFWKTGILERNMFFVLKRKE